MSNDVLPNNKLITPAQLAELHDGAWRWTMSIVSKDQATADDVLQQVYLKIIEGRARYDGRSTLKTWLYGVIRNTGYRHYRRRVKDQLKVAKFGADREIDGVGVIDDAPLARDRNKLLVAQAMNQLPARQREVLELTVYREFTLEQCASILGIGVGSVRTHYHRGKASLRNSLGGLSE
jgi:RNA polymerase sigma factor (sigma-70 family)